MAIEIPYLTELLRTYGLESMQDWAVGMIQTGASDEEFQAELYKQPAFRSRFSGYFELQDAGFPLPSIAEILDYEKTAFALAYQWRVPITIQEVQDAIGKNVSAREFGERIQLNANAVYHAPQETRDALNRMYGIDEGQLVKAFMNPNIEFGKLETQFGAAQLAGAANKSGWGDLTATQAENLYRTGMNLDTAGQTFSDLYRMRGLFSSIADNERWITPDDQLALISGDARVQEEVTNRAATRKAEFAGGGGGTQTQTGLTGYGSAQ
jgi:hypothetical protein